MLARAGLPKPHGPFYRAVIMGSMAIFLLVCVGSGSNVPSFLGGLIFYFGVDIYCSSDASEARAVLSILVFCWSKSKKSRF